MSPVVGIGQKSELLAAMRELGLSLDDINQVADEVERQITGNGGDLVDVVRDVDLPDIMRRVNCTLIAVRTGVPVPIARSALTLLAPEVLALAERYEP